MRIANPQNMNGQPLLAGIVTSGIISGDGTAENPLVVDVASIQVEVDSALSSTSTNPVQNKAVVSALAGKASSVHSHSISEVSGLQSALNGKQSSGNYAVLTGGKVATSAIPDLSGTYVATSTANAANGYAKLDGDGKIPTAVLPSYVSDVFEGYLVSGKFRKTNSSSGTEIAAKSNAIYVDLATNKTYRWSGSQYTEISASVALGRTAQTAFPGDAGSALETSVAGLSDAVNGKADASALNSYATTTAMNTALASKQDAITSTNKLAYSLISGTPSIPEVTTSLTSTGTNAVQAKTIYAELQKKANSSHTHTKSQITDFSHTHAQSDVTGLTDALAGKAASSHGHAIADVSGLSAALNGKADATALGDYATTEAMNTALAGKQNTITSTNKLDYSLISGTPSIPQVTTSLTSNGTNGVQAKTIYSALQGKAASSHDHAIAEVTGLQDALDGKQSAGNYAAATHTHAQSDVTGLATALAGKAATSHTHTKSQITDFSHTHAQSDVTGLVDALAGKASASHTHSQSEVEGLSDALAGKQDAITSSSKLAYTLISGTPTIPQVTTTLNATGTNAVQAKTIYSALSSKADASSLNSYATVEAMNTAIAAKADSSHEHSISEVSGLQDALDGKASSVHSHSQSEITGLTDALSSKATLTGGKLAASVIPDLSATYAKLSGGKVASSAVPDLSSTYVATSTANSANGYAKLDAQGKVPTSLLPSYVSDVFEGYLVSGKFRKTNSSSGTEIAAKSNAIYVDLNTNKTYRWGGTAYVEISSSLALGSTAETAYPGDSGAALSAAVASNSNAISGLQTTVDGKADSATVTSLSTRVGTLEGQTVTLDTELSSTSTNGVQNKAIDSAIKKRLPTYSSTANGRVLVSVSGGAAVSASNFTVNSTSAMGSSTTVIPNEAAVAGKLAGYATTSHTHTKSQITDFSHTHAQSDVTGLVNALAGKAASSHTHTKSEITDFSHTHAIADVTGLQSALDGKQAEITSSNRLDYSFISGGPSAPTTSLTSTGTNSVQAKTIYSAVEGAKTYADTKMAKVSSATENDLAKLNASGEVVDAGVSVQTSGTLDSSGTKVAVNSVVSAAIQSALSAMSWQAL